MNKTIPLPLRIDIYEEIISLVKREPNKVSFFDALEECATEYGHIAKIQYNVENIPQYYPELAGVSIPGLGENDYFITSTMKEAKELAERKKAEISAFRKAIKQSHEKLYGFNDDFVVNPTSQEASVSQVMKAFYGVLKNKAIEFNQFVAYSDTQYKDLSEAFDAFIMQYDYL